MTKEWFAKHLPGIVASSIVALIIYALGAYISSAISKEMKGYVPVTVWSQWAQERGEWRGSVDQQLRALKEDQVNLRRDIQASLSALDKKLDVQSALMSSKTDAQLAAIQDLKDTLKQHLSMPR